MFDENVLFSFNVAELTYINTIKCLIVYMGLCVQIYYNNN